MQDILDIKIIGLDTNRPPIIRKEPYIDLFFKLSHQVPEDWCDAFNALSKNLNHPAKINPGKALYIETYVRDMHQIVECLETLKRKVTSCNKQYIKRIQERELASLAEKAKAMGLGGKQEQLNSIINALDYDD